MLEMPKRKQRLLPTDFIVDLPRTKPEFEAAKNGNDRLSISLRNMHYRTVSYQIVIPTSDPSFRGN